MAFVPVSNTNYFKATEIKVGESITGYLIGAVENRKFKGKFDILMGDQDQQTVYTLSTAGNLSYLAQDVANGKKANYAGKLIRITRENNRVNKEGKEVSKFNVEVDSEQLMPNKWLVLSPQLNGTAPSAEGSTPAPAQSTSVSFSRPQNQQVPPQQAPKTGGFRPGGSSAPSASVQQAPQSTTTEAPVSMDGEKLAALFQNRFPGAQ